MTDPLPPLPKAILFDLDDTLISAYGRPRDAWETIIPEFAEDLQPLATRTVVDAVMEASEAFWMGPDTDHKKWRLQLSAARREIVKRTFNALPDFPRKMETDLINRIADRFSAFREEELEEFPGALETIDKLKDMGLKLALITNGAAETQRPKVERFGLEHRFDHIQIEGEHGFGKPEEEAYRHALNVLGVDASDTWMVGDNLEWEISAPQQIGIYAIWHDAYHHGLPEGSDIQPNRIIHAIPELLDHA